MYYVFGFSRCNGLIKNFVKKIVDAEFVKTCDELIHNVQRGALRDLKGAKLGVGVGTWIN